MEDQYLFAGNEETKQPNDHNNDDEDHQESHNNYFYHNKSVEKWNKFYHQDLVTRQYSKNIDEPIENNSISKL